MSRWKFGLWRRRCGGRGFGVLVGYKLVDQVAVYHESELIVELIESIKSKAYYNSLKLITKVLIVLFCKGPIY